MLTQSIRFVKMMKNIKTKRFVKLVSLALMVACLLSATILPSFAANGNYYKTRRYYINSVGGYFESNFTYNSSDDIIMYGETKIVSYPTYRGTLELRVLNTYETELASESVDSRNTNSNIINDSITHEYLESGSLSNKAVKGDITHTIYDSQSTVVSALRYQADWSLEEYWTGLEEVYAENVEPEN